jgi:hypothetical protein
LRGLCSSLRQFKLESCLYLFGEFLLLLLLRFSGLDCLEREPFSEFYSLIKGKQARGCGYGFRCTVAALIALLVDRLLLKAQRFI